MTRRSRRELERRLEELEEEKDAGDDPSLLDALLAADGEDST